MEHAGAAGHDILEFVARKAHESGRFGDVRRLGDRVECAAKDSAAPASYRIEQRPDGLFVSVVTPDRWLSQSIESDLMHTGDDLGKLIEEELDELGYPRGDAVPYKHFRSEDRLFTFESAVPAGTDGRASLEAAAAYVLAYEACFRQLGDMSGGNDEA